MLWRNFANLFGMCTVVLRSYRPLFSIYIIFGQGKFRMGAYSYIAASDNALREKWSGRQTAEDYQRKILMGKMLTN